MVSAEGGSTSVTLPGGVGKLLTTLANFSLWLGALALVAMMVHVTADVVLKITLNWPVAGTLEIVSYVYMVACTFLPLAHPRCDATQQWECGHCRALRAWKRESR